VKTSFQKNYADSIDNYIRIVLVKKGDLYNLHKVRESMKILYSLNVFSDVEVKALPVAENKLDIYFFCKHKYVIKDIVYHISSNYRVKKSSLQEKTYLKVSTYLESQDIQESVREIRSYLNSRGFQSPKISCILVKKLDKPQVAVHFHIQTGTLTRIVQSRISAVSPVYEIQLKKTFEDKYYIPAEFQSKLERFLKQLSEDNYFYADIKFNLTYLNRIKSEADLELVLDIGKKYSFNFTGIKDKSELFLEVWKAKVYENWALRETRTRISNYLKKKGYLRAEVKLDVEDKPRARIINIAVNRGQRYKLSKINFEGNNSVSNQRLFHLIKSDDKANNKLWYLDPTDLEHDREFLKLFYYLKEGFQKVDIDFVTIFKKNKVDIVFKITENRRVTVKSVGFKGNAAFKSDCLQKICKLKTGDIFIKKKVDDAVELLKRFYQSNGYEDVLIRLDITQDFKKEISFHILEGRHYKMGDLIIFGASSVQKKLIERLANVQNGRHLECKDVFAIQEELENSVIFNSVQFKKIKRPNRVIDLIINVIADDSEYYGIGFGIEKKQTWGARTTVEYSKKNLFNTYLAFSSMIQMGPRETRGIVAFDSPYFFGQKINSRFRIWMEHQIYPSFKFTRQGLGESLIKNSGANAYYLAGLNLYRTELTELSIPESPIDTIRQPFYIADLNLSYLQENRDNPFNPSTGHYFFVDLKMGLIDPFTNIRPFLKLKWDYQKNVPFLKRGVFSFTLRNGFLTNRMPITERFFGGGIYTFRGFHNTKLGPLTSESEPIGGGAFLFVNFDFTFPLNLIPVKDLYYSIFLDLGNVYAKAGDFDFAKLERACGLELKYKTSFGPLRISVGYNMRAYVKDRFIFFIGIGNVL
jgi:outer membrane protein assembly complex protein YaeT